MSDLLKTTTTVPLSVTHAAGWMCPLTPLAMRTGFGGQAASGSAPASADTTSSNGRAEGRFISVTWGRKGPASREWGDASRRGRPRPGGRPPGDRWPVHLLAYERDGCGSAWWHTSWHGGTVRAPTGGLSHSQAIPWPLAT